MDNSILEEKHQLLVSDFTPEYKQLYFHPEEGQNCKLNDSLDEIKYDLKNLNDIIIEKSNLVSFLLTNTIERLDIVNNKIQQEKERLQDIKMLCNKYTDFDRVVNITPSNSFGKFNYVNDTFKSYIDSYKRAGINIEEVTGNGIEGNKYVYKDFNYVDSVLKTNDRTALIDNKLSTYWEYERITASALEEFLIHDFYVDSEEAKCTITLFSKTQLNELEIVTDRDDLRIINLKYSYNGIDYKEVTIPEISINKKLDSYTKTGYVYGSNFVAVPNAYYIKITLQSNGYSNDQIAYERVLFKEDIAIENEINEVLKGTYIIPSAKRHLIKLSDIHAFYNKYATESFIQTKNLINKDEDIYAVGIFANVYLPNNLPDNSIQFVLTVNGVDYDVYPINSEYPGTKIIRYSKGKSNPDYTKLTTEVIRSVLLTVKMKSYKDATPYVNNIKVLLGGEV